MSVVPLLVLAFASTVVSFTAAAAPLDETRDRGPPTTRRTRRTRRPLPRRTHPDPDRATLDSGFLVTNLDLAFRARAEFA